MPRSRIHQNRARQQAACTLSTVACQGPVSIRTARASKRSAPSAPSLAKVPYPSEPRAPASGLHPQHRRVPRPRIHQNRARQQAACTLSTVACQGPVSIRTARASKRPAPSPPSRAKAPYPSEPRAPASGLHPQHRRVPRSRIHQNRARQQAVCTLSTVACQGPVSIRTARASKRSAPSAPSLAKVPYPSEPRASKRSAPSAPSRAKVPYPSEPRAPASGLHPQHRRVPRSRIHQNRAR